jgi:hypothetical protein
VKSGKTEAFFLPGWKYYRRRREATAATRMFVRHDGRSSD